MSHEFRTPLISILGFSELLSNDLAETDQKDMTQHIHSSGLRLLNTLDGVLRLSQLQTHTYPVNLIECDIIPIVHDLAKKFEIKANEKGLKFKTSLSTSSLLLVVDPVLFSDSIGNLLENGIKFTESGEIILSVLLEGDQFACISVNDTGIGIDSRDYDLVFEEFRQTSEGYKRNYDGCGLGLTLTKGIIEIMNGSIALSSEVGIGSKFSVYLPLINKPIKI
jgi:signal transduction histidine kinase